MEQALLKQLGKIIREARELAGMSVEGLALASRLDVDFVQSVEIGSTEPTMIQFLALSQGIGVEPADLLRDLEPYARVH